MVLVNDLVPHGGLCGYYFIVKVLLSLKSRYVNEKCKPRVIIILPKSLRYRVVFETMEGLGAGSGDKYLTTVTFIRD